MKNLMSRAEDFGGAVTLVFRPDALEAIWRTPDLERHYLRVDREDEETDDELVSRLYQEMGIE